MFAQVYTKVVYFFGPDDDISPDTLIASNGQVENLLKFKNNIIEEPQPGDNLWQCIMLITKDTKTDEEWAFWDLGKPVLLYSNSICEIGTIVNDRGNEIVLRYILGIALADNQRLMTWIFKAIEDLHASRPPLLD